MKRSGKNKPNKLKLEPDFSSIRLENDTPKVAEETDLRLHIEGAEQASEATTLEAVLHGVRSAVAEIDANPASEAEETLKAAPEAEETLRAAPKEVEAALTAAPEAEETLTVKPEAVEAAPELVEAAPELVEAKAEDAALPDSAAEAAEPAPAAPAEPAPVEAAEPAPAGEEADRRGASEPVDDETLLAELYALIGDSAPKPQPERAPAEQPVKAARPKPNVAQRPVARLTEQALKDVPEAYEDVDESDSTGVPGWLKGVFILLISLLLSAMTFYAVASDVIGEIF